MASEPIKLKLRNSEDFIFEGSDKVYTVLEPLPEQLFKIEKTIKELTEKDDNEGVYIALRDHLDSLGLPKSLGIGMSSLKQIQDMVNQKKKD